MSPLAFVPALVISVIALWLAARQIVVPLRSLRRQALKLAAGDFSAIEEKVGGVQEIRELQHGMMVMARRIQSAQQSLRRYIGRVTYAQEEERRRLAQDLHDETIQDLIALDQKIQLAGRSRGPEDGPRTPGLEALHREAQKAIQKVRRLSRALRPAYLEDLGLLPALEALAGDVGSTIGIPISVRAEGGQRPLPREADLAVYRIVQEALANVARHAAAHHAWIALLYRREELLVNVKDDGGASPLLWKPPIFPAAGTSASSGCRSGPNISARAWRCIPGRGRGPASLSTSPSVPHRPKCLWRHPHNCAPSEAGPLV